MGDRFPLEEDADRIRRGNVLRTGNLERDGLPGAGIQRHRLLHVSAVHGDLPHPLRIAKAGYRVVICAVGQRIDHCSIAVGDRLDSFFAVLCFQDHLGIFRTKSKCRGMLGFQRKVSQIDAVVSLVTTGVLDIGQRDHVAAFYIQGVLRPVYFSADFGAFIDDETVIYSPRTLGRHLVPEGKAALGNGFVNRNGHGDLRIALPLAVGAENAVLFHKLLTGLSLILVVMGVYHLGFPGQSVEHGTGEGFFCYGNLEFCSASVIGNHNGLYPGCRGIKAADSEALGDFPGGAVGVADCHYKAGSVQCVTNIIGRLGGLGFDRNAGDRFQGNRLNFALGKRNASLRAFHLLRCRCHHVVIGLVQKQGIDSVLSGGHFLAVQRHGDGVILRTVNLEAQGTPLALVLLKGDGTYLDFRTAVGLLFGNGKRSVLGCIALTADRVGVAAGGQGGGSRLPLAGGIHDGVATADGQFCRGRRDGKHSGSGRDLPGQNRILPGLYSEALAQHGGKVRTLHLLRCFSSSRLVVAVDTSGAAGIQIIAVFRCGIVHPSGNGAKIGGLFLHGNGTSAITVVQAAAATVIISCVADDTAQVCTGTVPLAGNLTLVIAVGNGCGLDLTGNTAGVALPPAERHAAGVAAAGDAAADTLSRDAGRILAAGGDGRCIQAVFNCTGAEARDTAHLIGTTDRTVSDDIVDGRAGGQLGKEPQLAVAGDGEGYLVPSAIKAAAESLPIGSGHRNVTCQNIIPTWIHGGKILGARHRLHRAGGQCRRRQKAEGQAQHQEKRKNPFFHKAPLL